MSALEVIECPMAATPDLASIASPYCTPIHAYIHTDTLPLTHTYFLTYMHTDKHAYTQTDTHTKYVLFVITSV